MLLKDLSLWSGLYAKQNYATKVNDDPIFKEIKLG